MRKLYIENGSDNPEKKLIVRINAKDSARIAALPRDDRRPERKRIRIYDFIRSRTFIVRTAPCGLDCWCAIETFPPSLAAKITSYERATIQSAGGGK